MDYETEDKLYPDQARKVRKARNQFVEHGFANMAALASILGLNPDYLKRRAETEHWADVRYEFLKSQSTEASDRLRKSLDEAGEDKLKQHTAVGHAIITELSELTLSMQNCKELADFKFLGAKISMVRDLAEAYQRTITPLREALGLHVGQPSAGMGEEGRDVKYNVDFQKLPPTQSTPAIEA